ncbi:MAG: 3-oxoacyl-[acyl-carrier-protein] synthase, KASII [uncultured Thermomicrobiales bacterium]|uniref:3-oxoacyl-[acyl-carrier-protein] synthase, KASII n=1 Tax=uncultured Thermomicrobiales bacterium TaxID=1645740 RepID=A0A6J4V7T3_9BACT|nr:MAG: 3-oxoacyl-[acyl-carrier-protein] synthase, KASII [uncultured Thermomicrobiales bacterium]
MADRSLRRVAITGIGPITAIGNGVDGLWDGVRRGTSAVRRIRCFDPSAFSCQVAAEVEFEPLDFMDPRKAHRLDRFSQLSLACALMALSDSGLSKTEAERAGMGIYTGSALGGIAFAETQHEVYVARGLRAVSPMLALSVFGGASSCNIAIELGLTGPSIANANSCASGAIAIGEAARIIRDGRATAMLAGGIEAPLAPLTFGSFSLIRVLTTRNDDPGTASRPFDADRDGFVMAEGGAMMVLEDLDHARARGATVYAELVGYGTTNDAHHMTAPRPDGAQAGRAMTEALADADLAPEAITYVNAHGSSTVLNDSTECRAIRLALGDHADHVAVSGTKGMHAHALGATGAIEAAIGALAITNGHLPGTTNLRSQDPACDLDVIPPGGRDVQTPYLISNSFGFGGINASLVLGAA